MLMLNPQAWMCSWVPGQQVGLQSGCYHHQWPDPVWTWPLDHMIEKHGCLQTDTLDHVLWSLLWLTYCTLVLKFCWRIQYHVANQAIHSQPANGLLAKQNNARGFLEVKSGPQNNFMSSSSIFYSVQYLTPRQYPNPPMANPKDLTSLNVAAENTCHWQHGSKFP